MKEKILSLASTVGFILIAVSMLIPLINGPYYTGQYFKYIYAAGALIMLVCSLMSPYRGNDRKLKGLYRVQSWSPVMFCAGAFFLFWPDGSLRDWIAFTLAGAVIRVYTNFAIASRANKISKGCK